MPTETFRATHMVRITNPNDNSQFVDVKVVDKIAFVDPHDSAQETDYTFDNHQDNTFRQVHVVTVTGTDNSSTVDVERIDVFSQLDPHDRGQETQYVMTGNAQEPPVHLQTHDFQITNPSNSNWWIKVQRIDQLSVLDPRDRGQETIFQLNNLDDDVSNPTTVDTSDDGSTINPPWRLDPFQNIIDVSWGGGSPAPGLAWVYLGLWGKVPLTQDPFSLNWALDGQFGWIIGFGCVISLPPANITGDGACFIVSSNGRFCQEGDPMYLNLPTDTNFHTVFPDAPWET